jgi:hypothetical protein
MLRSRSIVFALAVSFCLLLISPAWVSSASQNLKFTVHAGETIVKVIGEYQVQVEATDDVVVYLGLDDESLESSLEPGREAESDPFVTMTLLGPPDQVIFHGVVGDVILNLFYFDETGHTEG